MGMSEYKKLNQKLSERVKQSESLAPFTTYKIGGPAKYYFRAESADDVKNAVIAANELKIRFFILARGSNVLVADQGFDGLVIHNKSRSCYAVENGIIVDAGINLSQLANFAKEYSLTGIEFAAGIPGSLGGAIRGNASAWGRGIQDVVVKVVVINEVGKIAERNNQACQFQYRDSIFKHNNEVILSAELQLKKGNQEAIQKEIERVVNEKKEKQEFNLPSAGCVFKNPISNFNQLELERKKIDPAVINESGKIPAAYLIDEIGLKGKNIGGAVISDRHANFIVNTGNATAENVIMLIGIIKQKVRTQFGIQLEEEIQYVGF